MPFQRARFFITANEPFHSILLMKTGGYSGFPVGNKCLELSYTLLLLLFVGFVLGPFPNGGHL